MHANTDDDYLIDPRKLTNSTQLKKLRQVAISEARGNFWAFRQFMWPTMLHGWWQRHLARELQNFYRAYKKGRKPKLVLQAPPQHGKTRQVTDFSAWLAGQSPETKTIFASYSEELGVGVNLNLQRMIDTDKYREVFAGTQMNDPSIRSQSGRFIRNSNLLEWVNHTGSFRNTTILGQINGIGLDFGIIDDPLKGRKEAQSKNARDSTWSWLTDDFFLRFSENAALLMIMTRWHIDDPIGRWIEHFPDTKVLQYKAIATDENDWSVKAGYREVGDALFPEHKSLGFLEERRQLLTKASWESQYQQAPIVAGGGDLPVDQLRTVSNWNSRDNSAILASCRYWDCASSLAKEASRTAGVLLHRMKDGKWVISHVVHGQWQVSERERLIKFWAEQDSKVFKNYFVGVEQEPGSSGLDRAQMTVRNLAGFKTFADKVTGSKVDRAQPFAAQVQHGNVSLVAGDWVYDYISEAEVWPQGHDDQIDASSGAFNHLVKATTFDSSFSWV